MWSLLGNLPLNVSLFSVSCFQCYFSYYIKASSVLLCNFAVVRRINTKHLFSYFFIAAKNLPKKFDLKISLRERKAGYRFQEPSTDSETDTDTEVELSVDDFPTLRSSTGKTSGTFPQF